MSRMIDDEETLKDNGLIEIDGVNVAECQYYFYEDTEKAHTCRLIQVDDDLHYICKDNPDCYFKQLQRAKAENEKLKKEIDKWIEWNKSELEDLRNGKIQTEHFVASEKYYLGAIRALEQLCT